MEKYNNLPGLQSKLLRSQVALFSDAIKSFSTRNENNNNFWSYKRLYFRVCEVIGDQNSKNELHQNTATLF